MSTTLAPNAVEIELDTKIESQPSSTIVVPFSDAGYISYIDAFTPAGPSSTRTDNPGALHIRPLTIEEFEALQKLEQSSPAPAKSLTDALRKRLAQD
jgi:hypothetical protein